MKVYNIIVVVVVGVFLVGLEYCRVGIFSYSHSYSD